MACTRCDASDKPCLVMKFGGTSVGSAERMAQVASIVRTYAQTHRPIVVLSAMSSASKAQGTTSRLMNATLEVLRPGSTEYLRIIQAIEDDHVLAADKLLGDNATKRDLVIADLRAECQRLRNFMEAAEIIDELSPRSRDIIISAGEKLVCRLFSAALQQIGLEAANVPLDRCLDRAFDAKNLDQDFYNYLKQCALQRVLASCSKNEEVIPVVTGFIGLVPGGILNAIGRGYTDLTAALIASALKNQGELVAELQIWKEVDGVFSADPRKVPTAQLLKSIHPDEAAELTYYGSEVIHPFTMEQVIRSKVPIRIKNTFNPSSEGTLIVPDGLGECECFNHVHTAKDNVDIKATACTLKTNVLCVNIHSNRKSVSHGFFANIFGVLDRHGIVVDLISTSEVHVSMALSNTYTTASYDSAMNQSTTLSKLDMALEELRAFGSVSVIQDMAILSLVGRQMKNMVGIAGKMFSTLSQNGINIEIISQGASEINISCVISEENANTALVKIHDECVLKAW